jgi:phenylpyruvate tautomerase PptA (4-oxalocrotonate tautomerase family)
MSANNLSRRALLKIGAGAAVGSVSGALAQPAVPSGDPIVELYVPAGVLSLEQKAAAIKGFTEVILKALGRPADRTRRLFIAIIETAEGGFGVNGQVFMPRK